MPIHQAPEIVDRLKRRFGIVGSAGIDTIAPEIVPVVLVEDLQRERSFPLYRECIGGDTNGPVVAQFSYLQLLNPAGSNILVTIERFIVSATAAGAVDLRELDAALAGLSTLKGFRDRRIPGDPVAELRGGSDAGALGSQVGLVTIPANEALTVRVDYTLTPGRGFACNSDQTNVQFRASFFWTERTLLRVE